MSMQHLRGMSRVICAGVLAVGTLAIAVATCAARPGPGLDPDPGAIDAIFGEFTGQVPGVALAVVRDEKIVYSRGYGLANLDHAIPIAPNTVFDIGSTSKQFTAACIQLLAEDGKLALTDDIRKYFPELPQYERPITIAHLLHHTSGLRDYTALMGLAGLSIEPDYPEDVLLKLIYRQKGLNFPPGERFSYTNTGFFLLAEIVRQVSGMPMSQFAKARIFDPLGMTSTIFWDDHTMIVQRRAESYYPREDDRGGFMLAISLMDNVGDGGLYTTVEDLAKWDANFYHNKLGAGKPEFLDKMQEVGTLNNGQPIGYASGLFIGEHRGEKVVSHSGGWRGFRAEMMRFPERKLTVICLANGAAGSSALAAQVANLYLPGGPDASAAGAAQPATPAPSASPTITIPDAEWDKFLGRYKAETGPIWTLGRSGNELSIVSSSGLRFTARPIGPLEFESTNRPQQARLVFAANAGGKIAGITQTIATPPTPDVRLTPLEEVPDPAAGLDDFVGTYDSDELGVWMKATVSDGKLMFESVAEPKPFPLNRFAPSGFAVWGFDAVFTRGGDGKVDGFIMNSSRASGMRFVKRPPEPG